MTTSKRTAKGGLDGIARRFKLTIARLTFGRWVRLSRQENAIRRRIAELETAHGPDWEPKEREEEHLAMLNKRWERLQHLHNAAQTRTFTWFAWCLMIGMSLVLLVLAMADGMTRVRTTAHVRSIAFYTARPLDISQARDNVIFRVDYRLTVPATCFSDFMSPPALPRELTMTCGPEASVECTDLHLPAGTYVRLSHIDEDQYSLRIHEGEIGADSLTITWMNDKAEVLADGIQQTGVGTINVYGGHEAVDHAFLMNQPVIDIPALAVDSVWFDKLLERPRSSPMAISSLISGIVDFPGLKTPPIDLGERDTLAMRFLDGAHLRVAIDSTGMKIVVDGTVTSLLAGPKWNALSDLQRIPSRMAVLHERYPPEVWGAVYGVLISLWTYLFLKHRR